MPTASPFRALMGATTAAVGLALALLAGAPFIGALAAIAGGALAILLLFRTRGGEGGLAEQVPDEIAPPLPSTENLLEALDQPLLIIRDGRVLSANQAARSVLGEHIIGSDVRLAIRHPAAAERLARGRDDEESDQPIELAGLGEQDRRWEMVKRNIGEADVLVALTDRSDAHATEQMRSDFVANASHELRTPLATLLGFLETLQDEDAASNEKTRSRFLTIMFDEARRMKQLVEDLMSLSRIEAGRFSLPRETVDLLLLVEEARSNLRPLWEKKGVKLAIQSSAQPALVSGDRPQLLQLIMNILENAVRYGRDDSLVSISLDESASDMVRLAVSDQGDGIAPEHLPHLTRRFYRVDPGRSRAEGGTGLGLAIVKHIVDRHRGHLDIQSEVGQGTTVSVFLPCASV